VKNKPVEVKLSVLKVIYDAVIPIYHRLNSLLEDVVQKTIILSETDRSVLFEYCSCAGALKILFEEYFEMFSEEPKKEQVLVLSYEEYTSIMSLTKTVELSTRTTLGHLTLQEH
tara:strand:+ start:1600 stop:1941 length:342 start_codon:yes stop_codon:yes gene_type:complete